MSEKPHGKLGRGEQWVADELTRRGHVVVQQYPVFRFDRLGQFFIDVAIGRIAIELYTHWEAPWLNDGQILRSENLIMDGWRVLYVWMQGKANPEPSLIDSILEFKIDADAGSAHWFRTVSESGRLMRIGWLSHHNRLMTADAEQSNYPPKLDWHPEPPQPPAIPAPSPPRLGYRETPEELALENESRRQWYLYEQDFRAWEAERQRRKQPWERLSSMSPETRPRE